MSEPVQANIPRDSIVEFDNPRKYFDASKQAEIDESVALYGIIQPLLVRPLETRNGVMVYALIAGERRYRAAGACGLSEVPVLIKDVDKDTAFVLATVENTQREDMSPTEEAVAAARELTSQKGDLDETRRRLGWSRTKLEQRLALMRCAPEVRQALDERVIQLGHAELLAAVPVEKQVSSLAKIIENKLSVAFVRTNLAKVAQSLTAAIFDQTQCLTCNHNSACQRGLFAEAIDDGFCTNGPCYDEKTQEVLLMMKDELINDFPVVRIVAVGETVNAIPLTADGTMGVGEEQASACRACQNFGCTISALPQSAGKVESGLCFDAECNSTKVAQHLRSKKVETEQAKPGSPAKTKASPATPGKSTAKKAAVTTPTRVVEYRVRLWREVAKKELHANPEKALSVLVALAVSGNGRHVSGTKMTDAFRKLTQQTGSASFDAVMHSVVGNEAVRGKLVNAISASAMGEIQERELVATLQFLNANLLNHWKLCAEFLNLMTKSEIEVLAEELGLKKALGERFKAALAGKKDDFVKVLLNVQGFAYELALPTSLRYAKADKSAVAVVDNDASYEDAQDQDAVPDGHEQDEHALCETE